MISESTADVERRRETMSNDINVSVKAVHTWFVAIVTSRGERFAKNYDAKPTPEQVRDDFACDGMSFAPLT